MRIPHVRTTTRRTMVATAVVALMLGGSMAWQRHEYRKQVRYCLQQAGVFDGLQRDFLERAVAIERGDDVASYSGEVQGRAERVAWSRDEATSFARNAQFFRRVATLPLVLDDPDVPGVHLDTHAAR
jgi:hypothetical protein